MGKERGREGIEREWQMQVKGKGRDERREREIGWQKQGQKGEREGGNREGKNGKCWLREGEER